MKNFFSFVLFILPVVAIAQMRTATEDGYTYEYAENDPLKARIYTLDNGLKVFLTDYEEEPRIQTYIAVRAGSKHDPADNTGLAHYLEHMMFKGTDEIGSYDWEKEEKILQQISDQFEKHKYSNDQSERRAIYKVIDSLSLEASNLCIANEYDKMISSIGAKGTNAYTWVEQTVYVNEIPSNELEKWIKLESERFSQLVLRLFHTELEAVYEEFNRAQDNDFRKVLYTLSAEMFKKHQYGTQTTIGTGEHLKSPSMVRINEYFNKYYVPNNIAIVLSGDIDFKETVDLINQYFGGWKKKEVPPYVAPKESPIAGPIVKEVKGTQADNITIGWRLNAGAGSKNAMLLELTDMILMNGEAGLLDLDLNQQQKVLNASSSPTIMEDYGMFTLRGTPREGQTLAEVQTLLLGEIDKIKAGDFEDWLIQGSIADMKLRQITTYESNRGRANAMVEAFILGQTWSDHVNHLNEISKITKQDVVDFANKFFTPTNYIVINKRKGEDAKRHEVEKPEISDVNLNRGKQSKFFTEFEAMQSKPIAPKFVDYGQQIQSYSLMTAVEVSYIENTINKTFDLTYILDMGKDHDKKMALAISYLPYLGTKKYSAAELNQEFYKMGLSFNVNAGSDRVYVTLSGLDDNIKEGVELFEYVLANVKPDQDAYDKMVEGILKRRADSKLNKGRILQGAMLNYAVHGKNSSFRNILSEAELKSIDPEELTDRIKKINKYKHRIFYYGSSKITDVLNILNEVHPSSSKMIMYPEKMVYDELPIDKSKVYFVEYDMVQSEILMVSRGGKYDPAMQPAINLYNTYFGAGLSSIVFQEIRESRALAYSAFSRYITPSEKDKDYLTYAYVGTQADKMPEALAAMKEILVTMPESQDQFESAKASILKKIETERITQSSIFWSNESAKKRGLDHDARIEVYEFVKTATMKQMVDFQQKYVKPNTYVYLVIGKRENLDMEALSKLGEVEELNLEEIFNY